MFAAREVATGKITADACYPKHRHQDFLRFLKKVATAHPGVQLHVVCDNYATHKHPKVRAWIEVSGTWAVLPDGLQLRKQLHVQRCSLLPDVIKRSTRPDLR